jgi:hypothetical protein
MAKVVVKVFVLADAMVKLVLWVRRVPRLGSGSFFFLLCLLSTVCLQLLVDDGTVNSMYQYGEISVLCTKKDNKMRK